MKNLIKKNQLMITALAIMIAIAGYLQFAGNNLEDEYLSVDKEGISDVADNGGIITDNYTAEGIAEAANLDGSLDLSEEDLMAAGSNGVENTELTTNMEGLNPQSTDMENMDTETMDIESLDSEVNIALDDYLDEDMEVAEATPKEGEVPGEAVFTSTAGVTVLSEAKLLKEQTRAKNKETLLEIINSNGLTDVQKQEAVDSMVQMTEYAEKEAAAEILLEAKGFANAVVSIHSDGVDVVVNAAELSDAQRAQIEDIVTRKTDVAGENIVISTVNQ